MRFSSLVLPALLVLSAPAEASGRVALLIGNGAYGNPDFVLKNPANDVRALAAALERLEFEVRPAIDLSRDEMLASLEWFSTTARDADVAMVFFAGHSVQVGSENFVIGVDLAEVSAPAVAASSVTLTEIRAAVEGTGADLSMIVLDACRNNPLGDADVGRVGLAPISGGVGTLIAYATDPGNVAADGLGDNSIFTDALLDHIETPGIDVRIMFGRVRQDVVRETAGQQVPWVEEAIIGEHYLSDAPPPLAPDDELRIWREAVESGTVEGYRAYLGTFPRGLYELVAELRIDELQGQAVETEVLAANDLPQVSAALELLGYVVTRALTEPSEEYLRLAYSRWQATQPPGARDIDALMGEAARSATFLGTYAVGILRSDLNRFASIEAALGIARENLAVAEEDFGDDPDARPVLQGMRADVAEIEAIRETSASNLDASRTYYQDLLVLADRHLREWMTDETLPRFNSSRDLSLLPSRALSDARTFHEHLRIIRDAPPGSYAWLASMMENP